MEYEELKSIWDQYDQKLDRLERLNKKLITETMARKPQKKINRMLFQNIYGLVVAPAVLILALHRSFIRETYDVRFIIGCSLILVSLLFIIYIYSKGYFTLRTINLQDDSVLESVQKVTNFKNTMYGMFGKIRVEYLFMLLLPSGIMLIIWDGIQWDTRKILFFVGFIVLMIFWTNKKSQIHMAKIERLKKDILELKEYK